MSYPPRLGAASLDIKWSDAEGLVVLHGESKKELMKIEPQNLERGDWDQFWNALRDLEIQAFYRTDEYKAIVGQAEETK